MAAILPFIYSLSKYLLSTGCVLGSILGIKVTAVNKNRQICLTPLGSGEIDNERNKYLAYDVESVKRCGENKA